MAATGVRITVDGTTHPVHEDATGVSIVYRFATGEVAEVQVAKVGTELNLIVAGDVGRPDTDARGNFRMRIAPSK